MQVLYTQQMLAITTAKNLTNTGKTKKKKNLKSTSSPTIHFDVSNSNIFWMYLQRLRLQCFLFHNLLLKPYSCTI